MIIDPKREVGMLFRDPKNDCFWRLTWMGEGSVFAVYEEPNVDMTYRTAFGIERRLYVKPLNSLEESLDRALQEGPDLKDPATIFILQSQLGKGA